MYRIYSTGIETAAASMILIPILFFISNIYFPQHKKDGCLYYFNFIFDCNVLFGGGSQCDRD